MLRFGLYARKSKDDKSDVVKSIKDQVGICVSLAASHDLLVLRQYEENKSGKIPGKRPLYTQMVQDLRSGTINAILCWHVNRLGRNMQEAGELAQMLIDGVIQEIRTPFTTFRPGDNILPLILEQGMSAQYSLDLSRTIKLSMESVVNEGGWPHQAKLGYLNARDPLTVKRGIVVPDPERWDLTRKGFDLMLTGCYSVRQVIDQMNAWGLQTRPTPTRPGGPLSYALGYDMFQNPFYAGFTRHGGVVRKGKHAPMVTAAEFSKIQQIIARNRRSLGVRRRRQHPFTYTGIMTCGYCGLSVTAEHHFKSGKDRIYYHCSDPYSRCTKKGINEEALETELLDWLNRITLDAELVEIAEATLVRSLGEWSRSPEEALRLLHKSVSEVETQRNQLLELMLRGTVTDEALYKEKEAQLIRRRNELQLEVARTEQSLSRMHEQSRRGFAFVKLARDAFLTADMGLKRQIINALGLRYVLRGKELEVVLDPLLTEVVQFAAKIGASLEPEKTKKEGYQSQYSSFFSTNSCFGRDTEGLLEPAKPLIKALEEGEFPDVPL